MNHLSAFFVALFFSVSSFGLESDYQAEERKAILGCKMQAIEYAKIAKQEKKSFALTAALKSCKTIHSSKEYHFCMTKRLRKGEPLAQADDDCSDTKSHT